MGPVEEGADCREDHAGQTLRHLLLCSLQELVPGRRLWTGVDLGQNRGQAGVDPRQGRRKETVQSLNHRTGGKRSNVDLTIYSSCTILHSLCIYIHMYVDRYQLVNLPCYSHLCLVCSPSRVFSPSEANMSSPAAWDQAEVTCWREEEKEWRVDKVERRLVQMAVLHLARKSGNRGLSQFTSSSPVLSSC